MVSSLSWIIKVFVSSLESSYLVREPYKDARWRGLIVTKEITMEITMEIIPEITMEIPMDITRSYHGDPCMNGVLLG